MADDMGYGDAGCYGAPDIRTPHLDRLAAQGVKFTQFYANAPECSPTRTALLTGAYPQRVGGMECAIGTGNVGRYPEAMRLAERHELGLPVEDAVIPGQLVRAGYRAAIYGKWHLGYEKKFNPINYGWSEWLGCIGGNVDNHTHLEQDGTNGFYHNDRPVTRPGYMTHLLTDAALAFLDRNKGGPFFLYVPYTAPHFPFQPPDDPRPADPKKWLEGTRANYVKMVEDMDTQIGRILDALEQHGLTNNTVVIFTSDNGAMEPGRNLPWRGYKSATFEGGIRVPCVIRWPGRIQPGLLWERPALTMDLTASLLKLGGADKLPDRPIDGIDVIEHVATGKSPAERPLFWRFKRGDVTWWGALSGHTKYVRSQEGGKTEEWIFDLAGDPSEQMNLLTAKPEEAGRMRRMVSAWENEVRARR
jgi:N-acetylgalactosamine-6-sulfatase